MTVKAQILSGLREGPSTLPELLPYETPAHRLIAAHKLERIGQIQRVGERLVNSASKPATIWRLRHVQSF